jgi:hypothetical protein
MDTQTNEIQIEKVMEPSINRTEDNPSAVEAVYYVSRWVPVRTPVKRDDLLSEKAGIEARIIEIDDILAKIAVEDAKQVAVVEPVAEAIEPIIP